MEGIFNILLKNCGLGRNKKYHISVIMTRMKRGFITLVGTLIK
jgi:hypothetical protein